MPFIRAIFSLVKWLLGLDQEKPLQVIDNAKLINALKMSTEHGDGFRNMYGTDGSNTGIFPQKG